MAGHVQTGTLDGTLLGHRHGLMADQQPPCACPQDVPNMKQAGQEDTRPRSGSNQDQGEVSPQGHFGGLWENDYRKGFSHPWSCQENEPLNPSPTKLPHGQLDIDM